MHVYRKVSDGSYEVGFFADECWYKESTCHYEKDAIEMVHYLNGETKNLDEFNNYRPGK